MQPQPRHFFAASMREWHVDSDIERLIRHMKRDKHPFSLWYVPTDINETYDIEHHAPMVDGAVFLTTIHPKTK